MSPRFIGYTELFVFAGYHLCYLYKSNTMLKHTAVVRPSGWRRKASKERCFMAGLCHCVLCKDTDQFSAACLSADDGLHDELPKGSALNAVNTEGYRNDEFKAIHIIADAVVLPDMTAYTLLFQNAVLEYSLDSLAHIAAEYIIHVGMDTVPLSLIVITPLFIFQ